MKNIHIRTATVVKRLCSNFAKYGDTYQNLVEIWKEADENYITKYREWSNALHADKDSEMSKPSPPLRPVDRTGQYEGWIDYFKSDTNKIQEFSFAEFSKFCRDNWSWRKDHIRDINYYLDDRSLTANAIATNSIKVAALSSSMLAYSDNELDDDLYE